MFARFVSSIMLAFISTNIYWLLTVTYVKPVKNFGDKGVISGFEAANYLIKTYGVDVYLTGMSAYFIVVLIGCLASCFVVGKTNKNSVLVFKSYLLSLAFAFIYYLLDLKVYMVDLAHRRSALVGGYKAVSELGYLWLILSLMALSALIFITLLAQIRLCKYLARNQPGRLG